MKYIPSPIPIKYDYMYSATSNRSGRKGSRINYTVTIDERHAEGGHQPPSAKEVEDALAKLKGLQGMKELPTDERAHSFLLSGAKDTDLRAELFRLAVQRGWTLLELRRESQSLDAVFKDLTRRDEKLDRGDDWSGAYDGAEDEDEDEDDEDGEEQSAGPDDAAEGKN